MPRVIHLGCGKKKWAGSIGLDINPSSDADLICDLNACSYPFAESQFDLIVCEHVLEHLDDVVKTMEEIHRIAKSGARVLVRVPHYSSVYYYRDPTHKHPFSLHSFDYFLKETPVGQFHYSGVEYRLLAAEFPPPVDASILKRMFFRLINRYGDFYEKHLAFILPRHLMEFHLQVVK
jgi:SAM-dependent methyltransferase